MDIKIIESSISREEVARLAASQFVYMVKAVVDIEKGIMAIGGELHADAEALLAERGSKSNNMWGINLYPEKSADGWIEFDSMINLKPILNNRSRDVENIDTRNKIREIINKLIAN